MKKGILIIAAILVIFFTYFYYPNPFVMEELGSKIDSLNTEIELKKDYIQLAENEIILLEEKVFVAEKKLEDNKGKIKTIYQEYEVQVQTVDSYDVDLLEQFFSDRYQSSTGTKQ